METESIPSEKQKLTGRNVLFALLWFVILPGVSFYIIGELIDKKVIPLTRRQEDLALPLVVALAMGTLIGFFKFLMVLFKFIRQKI
jgi:hypothetical protein